MTCDELKTMTYPARTVKLLCPEGYPAPRIGPTGEAADGETPLQVRNLDKAGTRQ